MRIVNFLEIGNKIIDKIQSILQSKKAKNTSRYVIGNTVELAIALKTSEILKKTTSHEEYFNYHKLRDFEDIALIKIKNHDNNPIDLPYIENI